MRPGYKQTEVGVVPEDWEVVLLDSVAKRGSGHTPSKAHPEYWGGEIKWVSLQDSDRLDRLYIYDTAAQITPAGLANSSATMHAAGTGEEKRQAILEEWYRTQLKAAVPPADSGEGER